MTDDPNSLTVQKTNWTTIVTIASISGIFLIFIVALWVAGFFTFTGSDPSSKVVAAALALVGGLVAAVVSIIGIVLKYSIDQRTETRLQIEATRAAADRKAESDRASALQTQAEQRLGLEAAIRAVELLGKGEGDAGALQRAGALFALSNLDQHLLTLDLASFLLNKNGLEAGMACSLIDRALKRGDESTKRAAISMLYENAERMITPTTWEIPSCVENWDECLDTNIVREWAVFAVVKTLLARPVSVWKKLWPDLASVIATLGLAWESETDERIKSDIGAILRTVLTIFPNLGTLLHPKKAIDTTDLMIRVSNSVAASDYCSEILTQMESWKARDQPTT